MSTVDRALAVLGLFAGNRGEWTVEDISGELGLSQSTAYEYVRSLVDAGLLSSYATSRYVVGPAIIELDRQTRRRDPLILAAEKPLDILAKDFGADQVALLCRLYGFRVMCVDRRTSAAQHLAVSYERGRPMPLDRGSASKVILANLSPRVLKRYLSTKIAEADAPDWSDLRKRLSAIRKAGICITFGELDAGRIGVSSPVFSAGGDVVGSIGLVLAAADVDQAELNGISGRVIFAGRTVSEALRTIV